MSTPRRWVVGLVVLLGLGVVGWGFYGLLKEDPTSDMEVPGADLSTEFSEARFVGRWKGERQWAIEARVMSDNGNVVKLEAIENGVIYRNDEEYLTFQAGRAEWEKSRNGKLSNDLQLMDEVTVFQNGEPVLRTNRLEWSANEAILIAPEKVLFDFEGTRVEAGRLVLQSESNKVTLEEDIVVRLESGSLWEVANRLVYDLNTGEFTAMGPMRLETAE